MKTHVGRRFRLLLEKLDKAFQSAWAFVRNNLKTKKTKRHVELPSQKTKNS